MKIGVATGGGERRHRDEWLRTGLAQEAVGWGCLSAALITLSVGTLVVYLGDWVLQDSFVAATCLVLGGREMSNAVGFGVAPVSRAEVTVHVFNTATPECCCPDSDGVERCAEWQAVALDSVTSLHTPGDKSTFIREYGHAGTFEPCWHSSAKDKVVLELSWGGQMLALPLMVIAAAAAAGLVAALRARALGCPACPLPFGWQAGGRQAGGRQAGGRQAGGRKTGGSEEALDVPLVTTSPVRVEGELSGY